MRACGSLAMRGLMEQGTAAARTAHAGRIAANAVFADPFDQSVVLGDGAHRRMGDMRPGPKHRDRGRRNGNRRHAALVVEGDGLLVLVDATVFQIDEAQGVRNRGSLCRSSMMN